MKLKAWKFHVIPTTVALVVVAALVAGSAIAATAAGDREAAGARGAADLTGEISVLYSKDFKMIVGFSDPFWADVKTKFEQLYPNATLNTIGITGNANDLANAAALRFRSAKTAPDVLEFNTGFTAQFAASGFTRPLNKFLASPVDAPFWKNFPEGVKALGKVGKNVHAVTSGFNAYGLLYNKSMLKRAGVKLPWLPKSWTDVLQTARKVKSANPGVIPLWTPIGVAGGAGVMLQGTANFIFGSQTPVMFNQKTKRWVVDSPGLRATFSMYKSIFGQGLGPPLSYLVRNDAVGQGVGLLSTRKLAIAMAGNNWPVRYANPNSAEPFPTAPTEIGMAPMPTRLGQKPGAVTAVGGWALGMSRDTEHPDLAWALIKLLQSPEFSLKNALYSAHIPPDTTVAQKKAFVNAARPFQSFYVSLAAKYARALPTDADYPVYVRAVGVATDAIAKDPSISIESAIRLLQSTAAQQLGAEKVETIR